MPTDAQARCLLKLLAMAHGDGRVWNRGVEQHTVQVVWSRGWTTAAGLTPAGRDALARWLLRNFDPARTSGLTVEPLHLATWRFLKTRNHGETFATWLLRGLR
jgi:hypothetical protein